MSTPSTRPRPYELNHRIKSAAPGSTVQVPAGQYGDLKVHDENPASTIVVQAMGKVILTKLDISDCSNLTFQGPFEVAAPPESNEAVGVRDSTNITLDGMLVHGDFSCCKGIVGRRATNLLVRNCELYSVMCAVSVNESSNYKADNNHIHDIRRDAFMSVGLRGATFTNNLVHDMFPVGTAGTGGDHADSFQLYTDDEQGGACWDVVISNNVVFPGQGTGCQGPFINGSGHKNFTITNNWVLSGDAFANAISITGCDGVTIQNNWVLGHDDVGANIRVHDGDGPCSNVVQSPNVAIDQHSNQSAGDPLVPAISESLFDVLRKLTEGRAYAHTAAPPEAPPAR